MKRAEGRAESIGARVGAQRTSEADPPGRGGEAHSRNGS